MTWPSAGYRCGTGDRGLAAALAGWQEKYPGVPVRQDVIRGHPGRVLADYSARADLVVIGRHDRSGVGSIQHALLDRACGRVAVVPPGDRPPLASSHLDRPPRWPTIQVRRCGRNVAARP